MKTEEQKIARDLIAELRSIAESHKAIVTLADEIRLELKKDRYDSAKPRACPHCGVPL